MAEMKISVIIPSYNQGHFIEKTILSVLDQSYKKVELIIIDGGSTDNTADILQKYDPGISYWRSEKDKGQSHAFNKGLEIASGDYIGWINSDDVYYPGTFEAVIENLSSDPQTDVLFGDYDYIDETDNLIHRKKEIQFNPSEAYWTGKCNHANLAGFFKRKCFEKAGPLDESLHYAMDYDLYLRFGLMNCRFVQIRRPLGAYRIHSGSKTKQSRDKMLAEVSLVQKKYQTSFPCKLPEEFYCLYYRSSGIIKKTIGGCYSLKSISGIRHLYAKI